MLTLHVKPILSEDEVVAMAGVLLKDGAYDVLLQQDADVFTDTGEPLVKFRKGVLSSGACQAAYEALRAAATGTDNRGVSTGAIPFALPYKGQVGIQTRINVQLVRHDGALSKVIRSHAIVRSGIVGFFDRESRFPYCRQTAYSLKHPERFATALPLIREVDAVFEREAPACYAAQAEVVARTSPDFVIPGTVFTTLTVNRNWQTALHQDAGDLHEGFGVMTAFSGGGYGGGYLVFPRYGVAVDMRTTDLLLADVHQWHGNTPIRPTGTYERLSIVFYYRNNMQHCGTHDEELERAKHRQSGDRLYD